MDMKDDRAMMEQQERPYVLLFIGISIGYFFYSVVMG
jgi:hypothetical protein